MSVLGKTWIPGDMVNYVRTFGKKKPLTLYIRNRKQITDKADVVGEINQVLRH